MYFIFTFETQRIQVTVKFRILWITNLNRAIFNVNVHNDKKSDRYH